ncbi:pyridoxamine 5'-phosphate oxidase family protein [Brevibacterium aurantiacum]|uniref:Pyridoxamine 5'-phosphate oxidase family protein n=1 Tax=Brevibacterium aurantiacum TaxID=273384 RepID=A0A556CQN9_BREAU|nr:pyridoxamine 5'-phosphate oxidase family protein [Brevibacterium aurantiacum]TSI19723.1 pyridoxamine 5'-phosphate oxidase family protein [Brevibacterium aurantiacum]
MLHITRKPERQSTDLEKLEGLLDEQWWGVLSISRDAATGPAVITIPTLFVRVGDRILVHGSTGAGALGTNSTTTHADTAATISSGSPEGEGSTPPPASLPLSLCVTSMDGLVLAHSTFDSSVNYRSAVVYGHLESAAPADREALLLSFTDRLVPGRNAEVRAMTRKEIAATNVSVLRITDGQWVYKERTGDVGVPDENTKAWGGVIPFTTSYAEPQTAEWARGREIPDSVRQLR